MRSAILPILCDQEPLFQALERAQGGSRLPRGRLQRAPSAKLRLQALPHVLALAALSSGGASSKGFCLCLTPRANSRLGQEVDWAADVRLGGAAARVGSAWEGLPSA